MNQRCVWATASTNLETMKQEMPEPCRRKGCDGFQREPLCEAFIPAQQVLRFPEERTVPRVPMRCCRP